MSNTRKLVIEVVGDASKLDRGLRKAERSASGFSRRVQKKTGVGGLFGGSLGGVGKAGVFGAAAAAGTAVALKALSSVIAKAQEAETAQANLDQAFASAGLSAVKSGKQAETAIQRVSKRAAIDDEEVSRSFASLLRTTGSVEKATRDSALAADIARARRISLAAATKVVEKAETGQLRGLKALGVEIDKNTTASEAIDRAQKKFAGSAERYGNTAAGAQEKYHVALENVQERIGAKLLPLQTKLALKAVQFLDWADRNWPRFAKAISDAYNTAKPFIDAFIGQVKGVANIIAGVAKTVDALAHGDWSKAWKGFKQVAVDGVFGIVKAVSALPLKIAKALGKAAFAQIEKLFFGAVNRLIDIVNKAIGAYNSIPFVPNIGKIDHVGGSTTPARTSKGVTTRPDEGTRGPVVVDVYLDGSKVSSNQRRHNTIHARSNPKQRRGRPR